jgi:LPXTG-site transpeptidase (sortase) family protein
MQEVHSRKFATPGRRGTAAGRIMAGLIALVMMLALAAPAIALEPVSSSAQGEMPTTGGLRPGPVGLKPKPPATTGVRPVAIQIPQAKVDSEVEVTEIVDGVMQNPSGPFVVAWYKETGKLGENNANVVMAGHLDYWDVPQAVFYHLGDLKKGDKIEITGANKEQYDYKVDWVRNYKTAELTSKAIAEIVGQTDGETLTLITCGGPFDFQNGVYLERMVVRATRTS